MKYDLCGWLAEREKKDMEWMKNFKGLQHIGIPTNNMDKTVEFYYKLGFKTALETKDGDTRVVFLKFGDLVLETYENGQAKLRDGAIDHLAFHVEDIEEAYKFIQDQGFKILTEITFLPFWENGIKFFIIEGPNLERLEFAQYL